MFELLQPIFLYGMLGSIIPFIIHLFIKNKAKIVAFSSIKYLKAAYKNKSRQLKLKHWLLMLIRMGIISLFAFLLSKPILKHSDTAFLFSPLSRASIVVILDNSFSMTYTAQGVSHFSKAKEIMYDLLDTFKDGDKITVLTTDKKPKVIAGPYTMDTQEVKEKIMQEKPSHGVANMVDALLQAYKILEHSREAKKNIYIISDMQDYSFTSLLQQENVTLIEPEIPLFFLTLPADTSYKNITMENVQVKIKPYEDGRLINFSIRLRDYSYKSPVGDTTLSLVINRNKTLDKTLNAGDFTKDEYNLFYEVKGEKAVEGYLELSDDNITLDNRYYFYVPPPSAIPVLMVDSDGSRAEYLRDTFFLKHALNPYGTEKRFVPFLPTVISYDELEAQDIHKYAILVLANVEAIEEQAAALLDTYLTGGGVVWIFLGDKVNSENYNYKMREQRRYKGFLPGTITGLEKTEPDKEHFFTIDLEEKSNHPLFQFLSKVPLNIDAVKFYQCFKITLDEDENIQEIARFTNGQPAIIEKLYGEGKVIICNFPCNTAWTNFPVKTAFLPFVHSVIRLNVPQDETVRSFIVGDELILPQRMVKNAPAIEVVSPSNTIERIDTEDIVRNNTVVYDRFYEAGLYRIRIPEETIMDTAVNLDSRESDLTRIAAEKLKSFFHDMNVTVIDDITRLEGEIRKVNEGEPLWDYFLFVMLFLLLTEHFLSNRMR